MSKENVKISELPLGTDNLNGNEVIEISSPQPEGSEHPYKSKKLTLSRLGNWIGSVLNFDSLQTNAKNIIGAINELNSDGGFWNSVPDGPGAHNSFFRGADLGDPANIDWNTIAQDKFHNMFIGDFWKTYDQETDQWITWRIAAFDYFRGIGYKGNAAPHITVIPDEVIISGPTQIFTSTGIGAMNGYIWSDMRGYKSISETHLSNEGYILDMGNGKKVYAIDLEHDSVIGSPITIEDDVNYSTYWCVHYGNKLIYGVPQADPIIPTFNKVTVMYSYMNDSDTQITEETFTNSDVQTAYGETGMFDSNGYIILSHQALPYIVNDRSSIRTVNPSLIEILVDGQQIKPQNYALGLNGYQLTDVSFKSAQTIKVTYKYGNNYGGLNQTKRIIERAFGLNSHIMQTYRTIGGGSFILSGSRPIGTFRGWVHISDVELPTEQQITGNRTIGVEDNFTFNTENSINNEEINSECTQLPLFALRPDLRCCGKGYWLRDRCHATPLSRDPYVVSELNAFNTLYLGVNATGEVTAQSGTGGLSSFGVRPIFNLAYTQNPFIPPMVSN